MGSQHQLSSFTPAPTATESLTKLDEVDRTLIFICPAGILNFLQLGVDQNQAARPEQGMHPPVTQPDVPIQIPRGVIKQGSFQIPPPLHHACQKLRPAGIEGRVETYRNPQTGRSCCKMSIWRT